MSDEMILADPTNAGIAIDADGLQVVTTEADSIRSCHKCTAPVPDCANLTIVGETCCARCDHRV